MRKRLSKRITIEAEGKTEADLVEAIEEAGRKISDDCTVGTDSNDSGRYYFEVEKDIVPDPFTRAEKRLVLHIARFVLADAKIFDQVAMMLAVSDEQMWILREKVRKHLKKTG
jgi:hypothetical protein